MQHQHEACASDLGDDQSRYFFVAVVQVLCPELQLDNWFTSTSHVIGWEDSLQNDLYHVKWDVKPCYKDLVNYEDRLKHGL